MHVFSGEIIANALSDHDAGVFTGDKNSEWGKSGLKSWGFLAGTLVDSLDRKTAA